MEPQAQEILLELARDAVLSAACGGSEGPVADYEDLSELWQARGIFVTLHDHHGELRGCMGTAEAKAPLVMVVTEMARAAALEDQRFPPVRPEEVGELNLEVAVLSALKPVRAPSELQIGVHGLVVRGRGRQGLLLPDVAKERGWAASRYADQACLKAGLPPQAWQAEDVSMFCFGAEVIRGPSLGSDAWICRAG